MYFGPWLGCPPTPGGACSVAATKHTHKIFFFSAAICFEELGPHSAPRLSLLHPPEGTENYDSEGGWQTVGNQKNKACDQFLSALPWHPPPPK